MATKIRLMRLGKIRAPYYRIVVADSRTKREGRAIETIGKYHPKENPSLIELDSERVQYWLSVGAQPTEPVAAILRKTGDWQKFKGEPAPAPLLQPEAKPDRKAVFAKAAQEAAGIGGDDITRKAPKKTADKAEKPADTDKSADADAPAQGADAPAEAAAEAAPAEAAPAEAAADETPASE